jgi:tRNA-specific adenosine deaminase 2
MMCDELDETTAMQLMQMALDLCVNAVNCGEVPVACVMYNIKTQQVVAKAHNCTNASKNNAKHCEINCIEEMERKGMKEELKECVVVVTCEPCIMCAYALALCGVKGVVYGCENEKFGGNGSILSLHKFPGKEYYSKGGIMKEEAVNVLRTFYTNGNARAPEHKRHRKLK